MLVDDSSLLGGEESTGRGDESTTGHFGARGPGGAHPTRWFGPKGRETGQRTRCFCLRCFVYILTGEQERWRVRVNTVSNPPHHPERQIYDMSERV